LDLKTYLFSRLDLGDENSLDMGVEQVDLVDENTGEVRTVDGFQYALQEYFRKLPEEFVRHTSLVDAAIPRWLTLCFTCCWQTPIGR
jgi:hypothetical protein